jgi:heme exporter protein A
VLEVRNLEASRDDRVLFTALGFRLEPGHILQIAGRNGIGKTTLLNIVAGLAGAAAGEVLWQGEAVAGNESAYRAALSYIGHQAGLKQALSPLENLHFLCRLRGLSVEAAALGAALKKVGLAGYEDVPLARLSAGQRRRAGLARLFAEGSPLWILDEPFTAIDRSGVAELETWLGEHLAGGGMVLLTTHHAFAPGFPLQTLDVAAFRPGRGA